MIDRCNRHGINIFSLEKLAIILIKLATVSDNAFGVVARCLIDVAGSHLRDVVCGRVGMLGPDMSHSLTARSDVSDNDSVICSDHFAGGRGLILSVNRCF